MNANAVAPSYLPFAGLAHLQELPVPALATDPSFIFMWVGSGAGAAARCSPSVATAAARMSFGCAPTRPQTATDATTNSLPTHTKHHCLIGIRGTVRWEGDAADPVRKPPEMYTLIENFCLGTRRLELFSCARSSLRRGWVTALAPGSVEGAQWDADIRALAGGGTAGAVVPTSAEIDALRPKSPFRRRRRGPAGAPGGAAQGQLMAQPMMGMGMGMPMGGGMGGGVGMEGMMQRLGMMSGGMGAGMGGGMGGTRRATCIGKALKVTRF
ncbi:hypothetical protein FB451DRAFT_1569260 [Mycena latifolia]|nr:hypothetical protein FB451DRAFT_1569260 [Mycena latifolia]